MCRNSIILFQKYGWVDGQEYCHRCCVSLSNKNLLFQLFDVEGQKRLQQFRDLASSLHHWMKEQIVVMQVSN